MKVEATRTPVTPEDLGRALALAWLKLWDQMPGRRSIDLLLGQSAHETARWRSCMNWNLGNAKATARWDGDYCERPCNELLGKALAEDAVSRAGKRPDGTPDAVVTGSVATEMIVWFYPPNPASRFRAFDTLEAGALDYLSLLADRFSGAWGDVVAGEPTRFAQSLRALKYYTAPVETYAAALRSLAREYSHLDIDLTEPPADITGRLAADQDAMFRTFKPE